MAASHRLARAGYGPGAGNVVVGREQCIFAIAQNEPIEFAFQHPPHDIFLHAVAKIYASFGVHIDTHATRRHFRHEFRRAFDISAIQLYRATTFGIDEHHHIWLRFVVKVQPNRGIIADMYTRTINAIMA